MAITFLFYTAKKSEAVETGCNNVLGATLFLVVNNISLSTRVIKRVSFASVKTKTRKFLHVSRLYGMWRAERPILKTKIQPMAIAYCWFIKVRL